LIFAEKKEKMGAMSKIQLLFLSLAITLFAQEVEMEKNRELPRKCFLQPQTPPPSRNEESLIDPVTGQVCQNTRPSREIKQVCSVREAGGIYCDVAFLLWQSKMWGFEFIGKSTQPTGAGTSSVTLEEKVFVPDFSWRPGFKIDLGYDFGFDAWDIDSRWTFYKGEDTSLKKHFTSQIIPPGVGLVPLWFYPFYNVESPNQIRFSDGSMSWRHYFDSVDLEIGRLSKVTPKLSVHLFGGLKGAWMHQLYRIHYENGTTIDAIVPGVLGTVPYTLLESTLSFKNKSWGGGPRAGLNSKWNLFWGISLMADASLSLLYSRLETSRDQTDLNLNLDTVAEESFHMHLKTDTHQLKPVAEAKLGLDWTTCIYSNSTVGLSIAYELQYWWAQNELRRGESHAAPGDQFPSRGDLQMHGLTAEVSYSY
jgi:hypothetical protein